MRTENMTLVVEDLENEYGTFYRFETLTLSPIDRQLIDRNLLTPVEFDWLNAYHLRVYSALAEYLTNEEQMWLKEATKPL
jgi:Xaa-Pro aminopeptidase